MTAAADTSGQRCARCAELHRELSVLSRLCHLLQELNTLHMRRDNARRPIEALAVVGFVSIVALVLWAIGRLAVAIGGAS